MVNINIRTFVPPTGHMKIEEDVFSTTYTVEDAKFCTYKERKVVYVETRCLTQDKLIDVYVPGFIVAQKGAILLVMPILNAERSELEKMIGNHCTFW